MVITRVTHGRMIPSVERIESTFDQKPGQFLADSTFATGGNLSALANRGIEAVMPVEQTKLPDENPADRADPTQAVTEEDWPKLPRRAQTKKLDRAAFVYDAAKDCYYCPQGRPLEFVQIKTKGRDTGDASHYRVYTCRSCAGCALAADCLSGHAKHRSVSHDQHEAVRREVALRLKTESGKKTYARRAHLAETPNGFIKDVLGLRQFLLRGLDKVRTEWLWACTAFNIRKLMIAMEKLRADGSLEPV